MNTKWHLQNSQNSDTTLVHLHEELSRRNPYKSRGINPGSGGIIRICNDIYIPEQKIPVI